MKTKISFTLNKIAVIIVTFNGEKWIKKCIDSILKSSVSLTIFVIDNDSADGTIEILKQFQGIEIITLDENYGFGKANNIAILKALSLGFDSFFLLNQDTWIEENTIEKLVSHQNNNISFGVLSPMHFASDEVNLDENFANYLKKKQLFSESLFSVPFVNAAAWMVSRACFETVGLFEPEFNHYGEDRNFSDRVHFHGLNIGIVADAKIVHDRIVVRHFKKDLQQSKFLILISLININCSRFKSFMFALKQVIGLPKYFYKNYGVQKSLHLFFDLSGYFFNNLFNYQKIQQIRDDSKLGKNGF